MKEENLEKIPFTQYFTEMEKAEKAAFLAAILMYISVSYFYACLRGTFKFSLLMKEKIEAITGVEFNWDETTNTSEQ